MQWKSPWISRSKSKDFFAQAWSKYSLIVIGNIVFFALLYLFSYRPHNTENRAAEFLSLGQSAETSGRFEAAFEIYKKIQKDYEGTRAAGTARERLPKVQEKLAAVPTAPICIQKCEDFDLDEMLRKGPFIFTATYLARQLESNPSEEAKIRKIIWKYLGLAVNAEGVKLESLRHEKAFTSSRMQREFFDLNPQCKMQSDWIFDDFAIKNENFYAWKDAKIKLIVKQDKRQKEFVLSRESVQPGEVLPMLEFRASRSGGPVSCDIVLKTKDGQITSRQEL
jgi:hypothetical protein